MNIVQHLDRQKGPAALEKPTATTQVPGASKHFNKNQFNIKIDLPYQTGGGRPLTMQAKRSLNIFKSQRSDLAMPQCWKQKSRKGADASGEQRELEVLLDDQLRGPGAVKINPRFRKYQINKMVDHYFK